MSDRFPASHPIWTILQTVVATACFTGALYVTASNFDGTELTAIGGGGLATLIGSLLVTRKGSA